MTLDIWYLMATGAALGLAALGAFLWSIKHGLFEGAEDAKYIVFRDEDEE